MWICKYIHMYSYAYTHASTVVLLRPSQVHRDPYGFIELEGA